MESDLYDWNPSARMTLLVLALGTRREKEDYSDTFVQEDCPATAEELVGWCDMAQWRIALRVGKSDDQVGRDIKMFEQDGVITVRRWDDSNGAHHDMYMVNIAVVMEHERPAQKKNVKRPSRYKKPRKANKGSFSSTHQPKATIEDFAAEGVN